MAAPSFSSTPAGEPTGPTPPARLTPLRELQLVEAHRAGDSTALGELLAGYQRRIYAVCYRMVPDRETAADLTQDALIKVMEGLEGFDGRARLSTWVIRVTMNCCLSHLRRARIRRHASLDEGEAAGLPTLPQSPEPSALERIQRTEVREIAERALARLEEMPRAILILRDLNGLEYQQIAEVLDIPVGTVKSRIFRARAALREAIEEEAQQAGRSDAI